MPVVNGTVGCSLGTGLKHMHWEGLCSWLCGAAAGFVQRYGGTFYYIETHAGPGRYDLNGETFIGTPLRGLPVVHQRLGSGHYKATLIDSDHAVIVALRDQVEQLSHAGVVDAAAVACLEADYAQVIDTTISRTAAPSHFADRGVMLVDPNGDPDWRRLALVSHHARLAHIDLAIYFDARYVRRLRRAVPGAMRLQPHSPKWPAKDVRPLHERLPEFAKRVWLIRSPAGQHEGHEWTYLVGTNWDGIRDWAKGGFFRTDQPKGAALLEQLSLTKQERQIRRQPELEYGDGE